MQDRKGVKNEVWDCEGHKTVKLQNYAYVLITADGT